MDLFNGWWLTNNRWNSLKIRKMELIITGIGDKGDLKNERIGLKATKDCELKFYQLFNTEFLESGGFYNRSKAVFWFSPQSIKVGDKVVVYTRSGVDNAEIKDDGTTVYFMYWGLTEPIFTDDKKGIVLAEINNWKTTKDK